MVELGSWIFTEMFPVLDRAIPTPSAEMPMCPANGPAAIRRPSGLETEGGRPGGAVPGPDTGPAEAVGTHMRRANPTVVPVEMRRRVLVRVVCTEDPPSRATLGPDHPGLRLPGSAVNPAIAGLGEHVVGWPPAIRTRISGTKTRRPATWTR